MEEIEAFRQYLELRNFSKYTITRHYYNVRSYMAFCASKGCDPAQGREEDLLAYLVELRARGLRHASTSLIFTSLHTYYRWLMKQKRLPSNPIPDIVEEYLQEYKYSPQQRQIISIEDAQKIITATMMARDRAILYLLFTTGIRRNELMSLDVEDMDLEKMEVHLKPTAKRNNKTVFLTPECARALKRWLKIREQFKPESPALFIGSKNARFGSIGIDRMVSKAGERVGLHDPKSPRLEDKFTPHCCRHWLVTHLLRAGMKREYVKWLRGDVMKEAVDIYFHIDPEDVRKEFLAYVPQLGV